MLISSNGSAPQSLPGSRVQLVVGPGSLERVADELPYDVHDLSETARALAWSPETPEEEDVQEISERAGIHHRNGESEL